MRAPIWSGSRPYNGTGCEPRGAPAGGSQRTSMLPLKQAWKRRAKARHHVGCKPELRGAVRIGLDEYAGDVDCEPNGDEKERAGDDEMPDEHADEVNRSPDADVQGNHRDR